MASIVAAAKQLLFKLRDKGVLYWVTASIVLFVAFTGSGYVYGYFHLINLRSQFFQELVELAPRPVEPGFVKIVLIDDDEYWKGYLAGRRPIKRDYLARLVNFLVEANANVIGLDFDTRLPDPQSMDIPADYRVETEVLTKAIENAAQQGKKIVLSTPISYDNEQRYRRDPDIYQAHQLCKDDVSVRPIGGIASSGSSVPNIACGYIARPYDPLVIPGPLLMADGGYLDSFALALSRASNPDLVSHFLERVGNDVRYGNYMSEEKFREYGALFSASAVLQGAVNKQKFAASTVVIGAHWSRDAAGRGPRIDIHWTPVGWISGAVLHANFAEAFLDRRAIAATPDWAVRGTELLFALVAAVLFASVPSFWGKVGGLVGLVLFLFLVQWSALNFLGVFFDSLVPVLGLAIHSLSERLLGGHGTG